MNGAMISGTVSYCIGAITEGSQTLASISRAMMRAAVLGKGSAGLGRNSLGHNEYILRVRACKRENHLKD